MASLWTNWYEEWRRAYDSNEQLLNELLEYPEGYHSSLLANVRKRKEFLLLALQKREKWG